MVKLNLCGVVVDLQGKEKESRIHSKLVSIHDRSTSNAQYVSCSTCNRSIGMTRHSSSSVVASFVLTVAMGATLGADAFKEREQTKQ